MKQYKKGSDLVRQCEMLRNEQDSAQDQLKKPKDVADGRLRGLCGFRDHLLLCHSIDHPNGPIDLLT